MEWLAYLPLEGGGGVSTNALTFLNNNMGKKMHIISTLKLRKTSKQ